MKTSFIILSCIFFRSSLAFAEIGDVEKFKPMMDQAAIEQKSGNFKAATKLFKKVYAKSNDFKREAFYGLISSLKESKNWADAIEYLKAEKKENPFVGEYRVWLAETYTEAGQLNEALNEINYAEKILGHDKVVLRTKSFIQQRLGKHAEATDTLTIYLHNNPKDFNALADRGDSYFQQKIYNQAYKDFQYAYELRPFDERILSSYVQSAYFTHNHREIKKIGQECMRLFPRNIMCFEYMGKSSLQKQYFVNAAKYFNAALSLDSRRFDLRLLLAESLVATGHFTESDMHFKIVLDEQPTYEPALRRWTEILKQRKQIEPLGSALLAFNRNNPNNIWCAVELSKLLVLVGDEDAALKQMKTIAKETKSDVAQFYYAYFLYLEGRYNDSRTALIGAADPSLDIDFHLALLFLKENKLAEALQHWSKVPPESALYFKAQVNSALVFEQQNNLEKAKEILSAINPPADQRKYIEQKLSSPTGAEKRSTASDESNGLSYFTEWRMPLL